MEPWPEPEGTGGFGHEMARAQLMGHEEAGGSRWMCIGVE